MVNLPLFKLGALLVRQLSKTGAVSYSLLLKVLASSILITMYTQNRIKIQAHEHPRFRTIAIKYGQILHQWSLRMSVSALRDVAAEKRRKEKAEAPTVKTEEQMKAEEKQKAKAEEKGSEETVADAVKAHVAHEAKGEEHHQSVWKRKFRPLPEAKAVDLFADVAGDVFVLIIASGLIMWEYIRSKNKPDATAEKLGELSEHMKQEEAKIAELEEANKAQKERIDGLEHEVEMLKTPSTKKRGLLSLS
jgi:CRISPR/Cas system-associated protein endoribonuclease Cas2